MKQLKLVSWPSLAVEMNEINFFKTHFSIFISVSPTVNSRPSIARGSVYQFDLLVAIK